MADGPFSVADFSSRIAANGLASPNKFEVIFRAIPGAVKGAADLLQLSIMCDQVSLAGRDVQAVLDLQYGIRRQVVYNAPAYTPLSLSFLCTDKMDEKRILDEWNNRCVSVGGGFNVAYYNDYIGEYYGIALAYGRVTKIMGSEEDPLAGGRVIVLTEGKRQFDTWIRDLNGEKELECNWPEFFRKNQTNTNPENR